MMGTCCCTATRVGRSRSASDPKEKNKDAPKFAPVNKMDNDDEDAAHKSYPNMSSHETTLQNTTAHIALTLANQLEEQQPMELLNINISRTNGEIKQLPVMSTLTVSQMKQLIAKHIGTSEPKQQLKHNNIILENNQNISFYKIKDNDTINLYVLADSDVLEINVDYKSGTIKKTIFCSGNVKFIDFRKEVQGKIPNVALNQQQFFYNDIELNDDDKLLKDYGIINESTLRFEWKSVF